MKRFFACLTVLVVAIVASVGSSSMQIEDEGAFGTQGRLSNFSSVNNDGFSYTGILGSAFAYAESGTVSQSVTGSSHSPRSGFHTISIGNNIPALSFKGKPSDISWRHTEGKPVKVALRLYVLRV